MSGDSIHNTLTMESQFFVVMKSTLPPPPCPALLLLTPYIQSHIEMDSRLVNREAVQPLIMKFLPRVAICSATAPGRHLQAEEHGDCGGQTAEIGQEYGDKGHGPFSTWCNEPTCTSGRGFCLPCDY